MSTLSTCSYVSVGIHARRLWTSIRVCPRLRPRTRQACGIRGRRQCDFSICGDTLTYLGWGAYDPGIPQDCLDRSNSRIHVHVYVKRVSFLLVVSPLSGDFFAFLPLYKDNELWRILRMSAAPLSLSFSFFS